jgi:hypothetical protein
MKAYRGVDPLDFLGETGKRIEYLFLQRTNKFRGKLTPALSTSVHPRKKKI